MDFQLDNVSNEYKTRNILRLADRVQVIRLFNSHAKRPSYQSLATIFDCSAKQIKNILFHQNDILKEYEESGNDTHKASRDEAAQKRQEKIDFLGKVLHEYLQRVVYYNYSVDEEKVRQKALEIKECIAIENFQPNNGWFDHFKVAYGIKVFNRQSLQNNVQVEEEKKPDLSAIKLIHYVSQEEQKARKFNIAYGIKRKRGRPSNFEKLQWQSETALDPKIVNETIDDDDDVNDDYCTDEQDRNGSSDYNSNKDESILNRILLKPRPAASQTTTFHDQVVEEFNKPKRKPTTLDMYSQYPVQKHKRSDSPIPDIDSPERALKHVKALEEYSMLQDNYRAIGLLTQLEQIFKNKLKKSLNV